MILRLSQKLNTKIKAGMLTEMPLDENPYADWSCHVFTAIQAEPTRLDTFWQQEILDQSGA